MLSVLVDLSLALTLSTPHAVEGSAPQRSQEQRLVAQSSGGSPSPVRDENKPPTAPLRPDPDREGVLKQATPKQRTPEQAVGPKGTSATGGAPDAGAQSSGRQEVFDDPAHPRRPPATQSEGMKKARGSAARPDGGASVDTGPRAPGGGRPR